MTAGGPSRAERRSRERRGRERRKRERRATVPKQYDREYFDRWYRHSKVGVGARAFVARKVRLAVAAAEFVLARPVRTVLDVGCGEAPWRAILKRLRPGVEYTGFDSSEYVVARFGLRRGIRLAAFGEMGFVGLRGAYDLVVCADVLHYVRSSEVRAGLAAIAPHVGGVAFIEAFTSADAIEGDHAELQDRSPSVYRRFFAEAGFTPIGLHLYVTQKTAKSLVALERGAAG